MAKPYKSEIAKLVNTFEWTRAADITLLRQAIRTAAQSSILAVGSGGSLTVAHALISFHQRLTGRISTVATSLEAISEPLKSDAAAWLISAGGNNGDILAAAKALITCEPHQVTVLCGRENSRLSRLCRRHPFVNLLVYPPPAGKDGFLATNSVLGFTALLARAFSEEYDSGTEWYDVIEKVVPLLQNESGTVAEWHRMTSQLWERPTILVLHGPATRIGAIHLESNFTEAALGNLQFTDYRNFAHGRHHWLAKRGHDSAVLALVSVDDRALADRTLALIPPEIPTSRIEFEGLSAALVLGSLVAALRITGWAGHAHGIDPGRPGVPEFGRKLYHLPLSPHKRTSVARDLSERDAAAIARKTGLPLSFLNDLEDLEYWHNALNRFRDEIRKATFAGIVLDYDGTVVDTRYRYELPRDDVTSELVRLLDVGIHLGIATGRGKSVREALQTCLPETLWPLVFVGYYNGAEVATLCDDSAPDGTNEPCEDLAPLARALRAQPEIAEVAKQTDRRFQITLEAKRMVRTNRLWDLTHQTVLLSGCSNVMVTRSDHSIDIVAPGVSKLNVLTRLCECIGDKKVLKIGDQGCWPGNDYELLQGKFTLSVDQTNADPETCWNLGPRGQRGGVVTLNYLKALQEWRGEIRFRQKALQ